MTIDLHDHTTQRLLREAEDRAEQDAQSCVVRHAEPGYRPTTREREARRQRWEGMR